MSIEVMKRIKSLLQDGDKIDSHTISAVVAECDAVILTQQPDNASCKSVQKRHQAQQPATAIACGIPGMAKTTCPYCEQGFAFEHEQPATGEPDEWKLVPIVPTEKMLLAYTGGAVTNAGFGWCRHQWSVMLAAAPAAHPAPSVPDDVVRDAERYRWLRSLEHCNEAWCLIGSGNANSNLDAAIDAAMLAASS